MSNGLAMDLEKITVEQLEEYTATGDCKNLPTEVREYVRWLEMARDWYYKMKSRTWVIKQLKAVCKQPDGRKITDYMARKVYSDAMNFFYADMNIRKSSWRNMLAERALLAMSVAWNDGDMLTYLKGIDQLGKILQLDKDDEKDVDTRLLDRRPRVYMVKAEEVGFDEANKNELARMIDGMDIKESEKTKVKMEAGVLRRILFSNVEVEDAKEIDEDQGLNEDAQGKK